MANMGVPTTQEIECHYLWRGQLIIGMKNIGSATIWSQCSSYIPALGGKLCLRYSNDIHHLWRRILRTEPVQLSYNEPVKVGNKMVSAYAITSHQVQFVHLAQELCSERKILVDTVLNPGISVEVVVAPACTLMESWGLKGNECLPQPVLHILFITNSQQSSPYVSYRDQRNFMLKNNGTPVHQDGVGMLKTKRAGAGVLAQVSNAKLTRSQKGSQDFNSKSGVKPGQICAENKTKEFTSMNVVNTKHDLSSKTQKKKNKSKMLMLDTQKLHNVFRRKDKSRPDIIHPSMLKKTKKLNKDLCQGHQASNTKLENAKAHILPDVVGSVPSQNETFIQTDANRCINSCSTPENSPHTSKENSIKNSSTSKSNQSVSGETGEVIKGKKSTSSSSILFKKISREKENLKTTRGSNFLKVKEVVLSIAGKRKAEEGKVRGENSDNPVKKKLRVLKNFEMPGSKCKPKKINKKIASLEESQEASCYPKILERFYCSKSSKNHKLDEHVDQKLGMKIDISGDCSELKQGRNLEQKTDITDSVMSHPQQSALKNMKIPDSTIMKRNEDFFIAIKEQNVKRTSIHSPIELESSTEVAKKCDLEVERECDPAVQSIHNRSLDIVDGSQLSKTSQVIAEEERDLIILESARKCEKVVDNELESALNREASATLCKIANRSTKDSLKNENLKIKQQFAKQDPKPLIDDLLHREEGCQQQLGDEIPRPLKEKKTHTSKEDQQQLESSILITEENLDSDGEEDLHLFGKEPPETSEGEIPQSFREEDYNLSVQKCFQPLLKEHSRHLEECWESSENQPQPLQKSPHIMDEDLKIFGNGPQHIDESCHSSKEVHTSQEGAKFLEGGIPSSSEEFPSSHMLAYSLVGKYNPPETGFQCLQEGVQPLGQEPWGQEERLLSLREKPQSAEGLNWERVHPVENEIKNPEEITKIQVEDSYFSEEFAVDVDTKILKEPESQETGICTSSLESLTTVRDSDRVHCKSNSQNINKQLDEKMLTEIYVQRDRFEPSLPCLRDSNSELLRIVKEIQSHLQFHGSPGALNFWLIAQHEYLYPSVGKFFKEVQDRSQSQFLNKFSESIKTCKSWSTNTKQIMSGCGLNSDPGFQYHYKGKTLIDGTGPPEWNRFCSVSTSLERPRNLYEMKCNVEKTVTKKEIIFTKLDRGYYLQSRLISLNTKGIMLLAETTPPDWSKMGSFPTVSQMMLQQFEAVYLYTPLKLSAKLEAFQSTHHLSSAKEFEKNHTGSICICLQARFIESLFWDEELLDLVLSKDIKFGVYTCLSYIEKGKSWHILCRGTLLLIHHTSLADASLGDLVEGFIADRQRMTSGHLLVLPVTTLKTSYCVLKNARNLSSYDCTIRNTMKRTLELLVKCMSQGLAVLTPNTGEWKALDPCANLEKYLAYLPLLHRSFHYQHRIIKLVIGSDFCHMVDEQKHHYYGFITATEVLEKGYLE